MENSGSGESLAYRNEVENLEVCMRCPRGCRVNRRQGQAGSCGMTGTEIYLARAALHMWEEPCISGDTGSGAVFFSGCPLRCIYCQNYEIAHGEIGKPVTWERLAEIFLELQEQQAANINLVTPTHYTPEIICAVMLARKMGLRIPIVYNCSGYESTDMLRCLDGIVDIYLTDFKYMDSQMAEKYSHAPDYPEVAKKALQEMVRQQGTPVFSESGRMKAGVVVRHLLLPNHVKNAKNVVQYVYETYGNHVYVSLMNQYTPLPQVARFPELNRRVTKREYDRLIAYAMDLGIEQGFIQEGETSQESFIPAFDYEGVEKDSKRNAVREE